MGFDATDEESRRVSTCHAGTLPVVRWTCSTGIGERRRNRESGAGDNQTAAHRGRSFARGRTTPNGCMLQLHAACPNRIASSCMSPQFKCRCTGRAAPEDPFLSTVWSRRRQGFRRITARPAVVSSREANGHGNPMFPSGGGWATGMKGPGDALKSIWSFSSKEGRVLLLVAPSHTHSSERSPS